MTCRLPKPRRKPGTHQVRTRRTLSTGFETHFTELAGHTACVGPERSASRRAASVGLPGGGVSSRAERILAQRVEYIPHDSFFDSTTAKSLLSPAVPHCVADEETPQGLPAYLASLYETPLLTHDAEVRLFAKLNCLKFEACRLRETVNPKRPRQTTLDRIEALIHEATAVRNQIVRANLRLVVAIAKKFVNKNTGLEELVSEGHLPLIRAVELFDFSRGYHFSTYATWAVRNHFVRTLTDQKKLRTRYSTGESFIFETASETRSAVHESERRLARQRTLVAHYLEYLRPREQQILAARFGLADHGHPQTLSEIGRNLGISKERVRQVTIRALERLREFAAQESPAPVCS